MAKFLRISNFAWLSGITTPISEPSHRFRDMHDV